MKPILVRFTQFFQTGWRGVDKSTFHFGPWTRSVPSCHRSSHLIVPILKRNRLWLRQTSWGYFNFGSVQDFSFDNVAQSDTDLRESYLRTAGGISPRLSWHRNNFHFSSATWSAPCTHHPSTIVFFLDSKMAFDLMDRMVLFNVSLEGYAGEVRELSVSI